MREEFWKKEEFWWYIIIAIGTYYLSRIPMSGVIGYIIPAVPLTVAFIIIIRIRKKRREREKKYIPSKDPRAVIPTILENLLSEVKRVINNPTIPLRANVMLPRGNKLYIEYSVNMEDAPDLNMALDKGVGCAGTAWEIGKMVYGDLTIGRPQNWGLSKKQTEMTKLLKSILSVPIIAKGRVIGVLNLDSTEPIYKVKFDRRGVQRIVAKTALLIGEELLKFTVHRKGKA